MELWVDFTDFFGDVGVKEIETPTLITEFLRVRIIFKGP